MVMRVEAVAALNKGETVSEAAGVQEPILLKSQELRFFSPLQRCGP
jgi:hypothetical protein